MKKRMYERDVIAFLAENHDETALSLIDSVDPKLVKAFEKADRALKKALDDICKYFPDAHYYTSGGDSLCLLLGRSHGDYHESQQQLEVCQGISKVDGGDW
ncbi:MAG TPA: hypothetical protein DCX03_04385 [Bacteroidales bacterium]|nr:hypothetical protein [Bacteroidales bacterium]